MKKGKSIRAFLIAVIALALVAVAAICVFGADGTVIRGDVNGDGKVNSYDADYLLMHASFPNNPKYAINQSGDMNGDGKVNSYDADRLLMHASFPNNLKYALADSFSEGLEYELNSDGKGYTVTGIGDCKDTNLIIPSTYNNLPVTSIGDRAFYYCASLERITFGKGSKLTSIGEYAFSGCKSLEKIALPAGVTSISKAAFSGCTSLADITIPDSVTSIGEFAFSSCTNFTSVTIPDSVTSIGEYAFFDCYRLESITLSSSITSIGEGAFSECTSLASITVESGNTVYHSAGNCLIETESKTLVAGCKNSVIPTDGSVTSIGNDAFSGCRNLTSIKIPDSITSIGERAFQMCTSLEKIIFEGTEEQWNAVQKGTNWDSNAGSGPSSGKYELAYGGSDPEPPVTTTTTATTTTTTTTTEMVTTTLPMFARFDFGTDTTAQDDGQTSHEWLKNNLSYNESYIKVEFFEDSWKIYALKTYVSGTTPTDAYAVVFQNITDAEYADLVPGWGAWSRYPVQESYVGKTDSWNGKHQYMKIRIKNNTENNMISFGFKGNNNKFATTYCVSNMYLQGGDDKLTCTPSDEWAVYYYDVPKCCQVSSYAYGAGRNNNTDIGVATSFTQWVELYGPTGAYNGLNWTTVGGPCNGLKFNLLGAEKYQAKVPAWCDSRTNIKEGAAVEIDYIIFGSTIEQLEAYKSKIEKDPSLERPKPSDPEVNPSEGLSFVSYGDGTCYVSGIGSCTDTDIVIPAVSPDGDKVVRIHRSAFYNCTSLTSITIPDSVTSIGNEAFLGCTSLASVIFGENSELTGIGQYAFRGCEKLASIKIPDGVTGIGSWAFYNCTSLTSVIIPDSVINIFDSFYGCPIETATVPASAAGYIKNNKLKTVIITSGTSIDKEALSGCTSLTSVTIPDSVTSIGEKAFYGCTSLEGITIPEGVQNIGNSAFSGCSGLKSVTLPDSVQSIGEYVFIGCKSLEKITIPVGVTSISEGVFSGCSSLTNVTIPGSVTSVGDLAFDGCKSFTSITIPAGVQSIGNYVFYDCWNLESVTVESENTVYHSAGNCLIETASGKLILGCKNSVIPDDGSVTSIGNSAFYNCGGLASITIPASVTSIGVDAFRNCYGLTSIIIPSGVTGIGENAFYNCKNLAIVTISDSVTSIGDDAFYGTAYYKNEANWTDGVLYIGNHLIKANSEELPADYTIKAGTKVIADYAFEYCRKLTSIVIPESVMSISNYTFRYCTGLTSVTIPSSVTSIGEYAFEYCTSLKSVTVPSGVTRIGNSAFYSCTSLTSITMPNSVTNIGDGAFSGCTSLVGVTIPSSVTSIGDSVFSGCTNLANVTFGENSKLMSIGYGMFYNCTNLVSVTIPDSVTSIGGSAFSWCSSLANLMIPDSVTSIESSAFDGTAYYNNEANWTDGVLYIGKYLIAVKSEELPTDYTIKVGTKCIAGGAFEYCHSLTNITIPEGVTSIGSWAFFSCTSLEKIIFKGTEEQWNAIAKGDGWNDNAGSNTSSGKYTLVFAPEANPSEGLEFTLNADGNSYSVTGIGTCADTEVVIPSAYNGLPVTGIGDRAFSYCGRLTNVTIPGTVTSIGDYAFFGCGSLASIVIPDSVTAIGNGAINSERDFRKTQNNIENSLQMIA